WSDRSDAAFVRTNCAVLHDSLLSSELFGHEKGAFTGAHVRKEGRFELAHGGTLFLDEIGEISPEIQAKLLRVLETGEFERVGGKETLRVDVRVICATNRDLEGMIADGRFREDLYYRLNVVPIELPALRERPEDISPLFRHFVEKYSREQDTRPLNIDQAMIETLQAMPWPGNVRELANVAQRCVLIGDASPVTASLRQRTAAGAESKTHELVGRTIADVERELILATLDRTRSNKTEAARLLGVTARTLSNKIKFWRAHGLLPAGMEL
ncbi:MAG: sigma-54-dependent Fis family transcriptional regulator, partial [Planctomycetes bacterium]|nr:sigma-54-dependent Fis family transcriptional regulator [Planctomycetota bacterium]